jgi:transcriptional regulator with XRE-family HTH domain
MQEISEQLHAYMRARKLSQSELASRAGVNQATVSRALRKQPTRHSRALQRLCIYADIEYGEGPKSTTSSSKLIIEAFQEVWDGTDAHAAAIARIIQASKGLRPEKI